MRQCENSVAPGVVLAGQGKGGQVLADVLFPAGKSTKKRPVPLRKSATLQEQCGVLAGLERGAPALGCCVWCNSAETVWRKLIALMGIEFHPLEGALFLTPEKGRKRAPPQGATKITFKREIL